jgi:Cu-Zn family superoxide dismutase
MRKLLSILLLSSFFSLAFASTVTIPVYLTKEGATPIGTVTATDSAYGLILTPHLKELTPGTHGFHVHVNPSCAQQGMAAGGHLDPNNTGKHLGPYNAAGHLGDLPVLIVNADGTATLPVLAPRLTVALIRNHSLMIHAGSDNYSDSPMMGGGGARFACGVIK